MTDCIALYPIEQVYKKFWKGGHWPLPPGSIPESYVHLFVYFSSLMQYEACINGQWVGLPTASKKAIK